MEKLPEEIMNLLSREGLDAGDMIDWMVCDRGINGGFVDTYLILTKDSLYRISNEHEKNKEKVFKGFRALKKKEIIPQSIEKVQDYDVEVFHIEEIESVFIVNLIASGLVVIKMPEEKAIAAVTNGTMGEATTFVSTVMKLIKDEPIERLVEEEASKKACPTCGMIFPEEGRQVCPKCLKKGAIFTRLLGFTTSHKWSIFLIILFMLLNSATGLVIPYLQGTVLFDQALGGTGRFAGENCACHFPNHFFPVIVTGLWYFVWCDQCTDGSEYCL